MPVEDSSKPYPWILNPVLDVLLCCGGLVWILYFAHDLFLELLSPRLALSTAMFSVAATQVLGEAHVCATLFRIYGDKEIRKRYKLCTVWQPLCFLVLMLAGLVVPGVTPFMLKIYLLWVFQHFAAQAYGLLLVYCHKHNYPMSVYDKKVLFLVLNCTAALAIVKQLTFEHWAPVYFMDQKLPAWPLLPESVFVCVGTLLQLSVCLFSFQICRKCFLDRKQFPFPAMLMLFTIVTSFVATRGTLGQLLIYLPAFFHASQYLAITGSQFLKESCPGIASNQIWKEFCKQGGIRYCSRLFAIALCLYVVLPNFIQLFGVSSSLAFASIFCALNLHHFMTDMQIWKLRDQKNRASMV